MANILHKIRAYLYKYTLNKEDEEYVARAAMERSLGIKEICESAVARGGANTTPGAMRHNVEMFLEEMTYLLCDSYSVNLGYFTAKVNIKGKFNKTDTTFDPQRHSLYFTLCQGELMSKHIDRVDVRLMGLAKCGAIIDQVTDVKSGSVNGILTPGRNLKIRGQKIKLAGDDAAVGIYFHNIDTGAVVKIDDRSVVVNSCAGMIIDIPPLTAGSYHLEILTQYSGSFILKTPRSAFFDRPLVVE